MTPVEFEQLASEGYNRIPVAREVLADCDTSLSTYLKLANRPYTYLLESVQGGEKWGRYSIIGLSCHTVFKVMGHELVIETEGKVVEQRSCRDPLKEVEKFIGRYRVPALDSLGRFHGGLVGYFGYDTVRYIEPKLAESQPEDVIGTPDILLMLSDDLVVCDNLRGKIQFITHSDPSEEGALEKANRRIDGFLQTFRNTPVVIAEAGNGEIVPEQVFVSSFGEQKFKAGVDKIREYILAGDALQVVLSQRVSIPFSENPLDLYRALRCLNPSPYMYYLNLGDFYVVGSSPEILVRLEEGKVTVRPMAGTRKRGENEEKDQLLEQELLNDPKEIAEHLMLIDLGRNDVGRVAKTGTVELTEKMIVERYSHVMHIVSNVTGQIKEGLGAMDVLRATFPAGTLSGAPKVRAMEIIDELEPVKRGIYGGAVGYLGWNGNMDTAIAIRTAVIKDQQLHIQAGAGIVVDSQPELEWQETMNKGRAIFRAVDRVRQGLDN